MIGIIVNDVEMGGAGRAFTPTGHAYGYGYGGYGGYRSYGKGYRPYAPYGPVETAKKPGGAPDADGKAPDAAAPAGETVHQDRAAVNPELTDEE